MSFEVVYLTGSPASGKSTLSKEAQSLADLAVWDYGAELLKRVLSRTGTTYEELRGNSGSLITGDDVRRTDDELIEWVRLQRQERHVLIDTHAVTREPYGFRITPFSTDQILRLAPTILVSLFVAPSIAVERIAKAADGRLTVTEFEAGFHSGLQASVLATYSIALGKPAYILDGAKEKAELARWIVDRLKPR